MPCNFNALPTTGKCEGGWTWHVEEGVYGDVPLDGLNFSVYVNWPGAIHHGNGEAVVFIDELADDRQRSAVETLVGGTAGGPWGVLAWTWPKVHGPYRVAYDIVLPRSRSRSAVPAGTTFARPRSVQFAVKSVPMESGPPTRCKHCGSLKGTYGLSVPKKYPLSPCHVTLPFGFSHGPTTSGRPLA